MIKNFFTLVFFISIINSGIVKSQNIHQDISCKLDIISHSMEAIVDISFKETYNNTNGYFFRLNKNLAVLSSGLKIEKQPAADAGSNYMTYKIVADEGQSLKKFQIKYSGVIYEKPDGGVAEYARGFSQTPGIIGEDGVYLGGASYWVPSFGDELFTYKLSIDLPKEWLAVSQGEKSTYEHSIVYSCSKPQEEIYLIAAKYSFYENDYEGIKIQAFLRNADNDLATRYLEATANYMKMYIQMLGEYPYTKFALVENFWETGYGMPSFTLLGEKVIRFPFILYSSYPHELLHNYWGNSVYVDYSGGNWCEGITAYMADHMLKEQQGQGAEYRRSTLQKYTDFVNESNDFPLTSFLNRNNAAEEAIGYGKCLMMNHMLRMKMGDEQFLNGYRKFYQDFIFKRASFTDIEQEFMQLAKWDVPAFFNQWVNLEGAPSFKIDNVRKTMVKNEWVLNFNIIQTQKEPEFIMDIPVAVYFEDTVVKLVFSVQSKNEEISYKSIKQPLRVELDPEFDVFRKLDSRESPSAISQIIGDKKLLIVLPSADPLLAAYQKMAKTWKESGAMTGITVIIVMDNAITKLPKDKSVWVIGKNNKLKSKLPGLESLKSQVTDKEYETLSIAMKSGSIVLTSNPTDAQGITYGFISCSEASAVEGLTRLLPHYGKYSVLAFEGSRPNNTAKIVLNALNSPLHFQFPDATNLDLSKIHLLPSMPLTR